MVTAQANLILEEFMDKLKNACNSLLLLDYDGTLAPFKINRDQAIPYPGVRTLLQQIMRTGKSRVVLISGRPCGEIAQLLNLEFLPEIWGMHGWQRLLRDGSCTRYVMEDEDRDALTIASTWISALGYAHLSERKQSGIAVHWRGLPNEDIEHIRLSINATGMPVQCARRMYLREFNGGMELQLKSRTKFTAVETLLQETDLHAPLAYLGDDQTDEDAFAALHARGLRVLVASDLHKTQADILLRPPEELLEFLLRWLLACGGTQ